MTLDFLAGRVFQCDYIDASTHRKKVLQSALARHPLLPGLETRAGELISRNRGPSLFDASWELKASFSLEEVAALEPNGSIQKCGLVAGYVAGFEIQRKSYDDGSEYINTYLRLYVDGASVLEGGPAPQVVFDLAISCCQNRYEFHEKARLKGAYICYWRIDDWLEGNSWDETVCEGSPCFPNG